MSNSGNVSWFGVLQRGQHYMKTWPDDKRLSPVFPEHRVGRRYALLCALCRRWLSLPSAGRLHCMRS